VMIALSVLKIDAEMLSIGLSWRFSPKSGFRGIKGEVLTLGTCPPNLVVVFTCVTHVHVPNLRKIGQKLRSLSWTKGLCGHTDTHTYTHTHRHTLK